MMNTIRIIQPERAPVTRATTSAPSKTEIGLSIANGRAEKAVLGAILAAPEMLSTLRDVLSADDFYSKFHAGVFAICCELEDAGAAVDLQTVGDRVYQRFHAQPGKPVDDGIRMMVDNMLLECITVSPVPENALTYADAVRQAAHALRVLQAADAIKEAVVSEGLRGDALTDRCNLTIFAATEQYAKQDLTAQDMAAAYLDVMEARVNSDTPRGVRSGWRDLDDIVGGFVPGEVTIWAGSAGAGKTTVMLSALRTFALYERAPTVLFSIEMSREEIMHKMVAMETGLSPVKLKLGALDNKDDLALLVEGVGIVSRYAWRVYDEFRPLRPAQLRRKLRALLAREAVSQVVIDGLWLMKGDLAANGEERYQRDRVREVGDIMEELTKIAREFSVHIHIVHQFKQEIVWRTDGKRVPRLDDLAESSAVQRTAQNVIGIYSSWYIAQREGQIPEHYNTNLYVLKTRIGSAPGRKAEIYYDRSMWGYPVAGDGKAAKR